MIYGPSKRRPIYARLIDLLFTPPDLRGSQQCLAVCVLESAPVMGNRPRQIDIANAGVPGHLLALGLRYGELGSKLILIESRILATCHK